MEKPSKKHFADSDTPFDLLTGGNGTRRRVGSYDKPSYRRRRRETLRRRNVRAQKWGPGTSITVYVGLSGLHSRQAPFTYPRKPQRNNTRQLSALRNA